ncbi:lactoferrin/transferrin family TonB-dependent receptor [Testudinibacter sp. P80/BLE/0925]
MKPLSHIVALTLLGQLAYHQAAYANEDEQLDEIRVVGSIGEISKSQRNISRVVKNAEQLRREQVNDIRDLTRYDPGIAVNEQGSGASAGYSIRGVDKDRVAILVDGISQAQNYMPRSNYAERFSGAKNEIEFENIKAVEISQGANSVAAGNSALGGAVMFVTKDPSDVIKPDQNWGVNLKSSYSSKDQRWGNSIAAAGQAGGFSALLQYTRRDGHEIKSHSDTPSQTLDRLYPTEYQYEDLRKSGWTSAVRPAHFPQTEGCLEGHSPANCIQSSTYAPNDVYGLTRNAANPMDYRSDSAFGKFQYEFNPSHKIGFVFENTKQRYEIEDRANRAKPFYRNYKDSGASNDSTDWKHRPLFPHYKFVDHKHDKKREGFFYEYQAENNKSWLDSAKIELDQEKVSITSIHTESACTLRGETPNQNCELFRRNDLGIKLVEGGAPIGYQMWKRSNATLTEQTKRIRFSGKKVLDYFGIKHEIDLLAGIGRSRFDLVEGLNYKRYDEVVPADHECHQDTRFKCQKFNHGLMQIEKELSSKQDHPIKGKNYYFGVSNNWELGKYVDLSGGIRYDSYKFDSSNPAFKNDDYSSLSWAAGIAVNLTENITLSYKASTGFRVPNAQEMYGTDLQRKRGVQSREKIQAEKAFNQEVGFDIHGNVGYITANVFRADYKNFITLKRRMNDDTITSQKEMVSYYGNQEEAHSAGFNVRGVLDFHALWKTLPDGLSGSAAYSKVRPRKLGKVSGNSQNMLESSYAMDSLQPAKFILGLDYDAPTGKWGSGIRFTRSDAKKASELVSTKPNIDTRGVRNIGVVRTVSKSWYTWDWVGYVNIGKNVTLRGGIYNLTNAKYVTWESLRQTGITGLSTGVTAEVEGLGYDRLTAPGRNFALSVEVNF